MDVKVLIQYSYQESDQVMQYAGQHYQESHQIMQSLLY